MQAIGENAPAAHPFSMFFRRKIKPAPACDEPSLQDSQQGTPATDSRKILLVDDDPVVRMALSFKLKACGFNVIAASDVSQALAATRKENPDLVLLDVNFPAEIGSMEWNGFSLAQWIRRMDETRELPVIVMSGSDKPDYARRATDCGANAFLRKPLDQGSLLNSITTALTTGKETKSAPLASRELQEQSKAE